ncbi:hypothetical protein NSR52_000755 [Salmonella enterica]|nr:hypothetical protein [Salmonella enterica subsp. enterica]EJW2018228.1 hypothetical protein [Salmonella enterica]EHW9182642.1 hypothetical protein [Salmonella enterica subsp. enterica]EJW2022733.1 hypothetical protein [Salmonella enterica]EJW2098442.1 hypothetical protein [Salmonella enterica]
MFSHFNHSLFTSRNLTDADILTLADCSVVTFPGSTDVLSLVSQVDDNSATLVELYQQVIQASQVLTHQGENAYYQQCHNQLLENLLRYAEMLKLHTLFSGAWDIADELYEIEMLLTNRLAWRREAFRQTPKYLWWRDEACHTLTQMDADGEPLSADIATLLVKEARAIAAENTQSGLPPAPDKWLRYSIWWATPLEALMRSVLTAITVQGNNHA